MEKLMIQMSSANADADDSYPRRDIVSHLAQTSYSVPDRVTRAPKESETSWKESRRLQHVSGYQNIGGMTVRFALYFTICVALAHR
jgi:hypothetical protein